MTAAPPPSEPQFQTPAPPPRRHPVWAVIVGSILTLIGGLLTLLFLVRLPVVLAEAGRRQATDPGYGTGMAVGGIVMTLVAVAILAGGIALLVRRR